VTERLPGRQKAMELGRALRRIDDRVLRRERSDAPRRVWYQGPELYLDVFFEDGPRGLEWFQATVRGRALTWDSGRGCIVTGHTNELETAGPAHPASKAVVFCPGPDSEVIEVVRWLFAARAGEALFDQASDILAHWASPARR